MTAASFWFGFAVCAVAMALLKLAKLVTANRDRLQLPKAQQTKWSTLRKRWTGTISVRR